MSVIYDATPAGLEAACAMMAASHNPKLPLLRAAADGCIALAWAVRPDVEWPFNAITPAQPAVVLIGDDPYPERAAVGPARWAIAKRLRTWPRAVIVHGAAGLAEHYREAVLAAGLVGRCIMIETDATHVEAWAEWFGCPSTLLILPKHGRHPVMPNKGEVH